MRQSRHRVWLLIVGCIVLCALFGVPLSFNDGDDPRDSLRPADGPRSSSEEPFCALPAVGGHRLVARTDARPSSAARALLAAVPGGLCLLI